MRRGMGLVMGVGMDIEVVMDREEGGYACIIVMKGRKPSTTHQSRQHLGGGKCSWD